MKTIIQLYTLITLGLLAWQPAFSVELVDDSPDLGGFTPTDKWQEGEVKIPGYPDEDKLIEVGMERTNTPFTYYIDPDTLSVGKDDVVRYMVVIKSGSGASNVLYEGIRCSVTEYRTYAYGTSDGKMNKATVSEWKPFYENDNMLHRYNFYHYYLCDKTQLPYKKEIMLQRIRYPDEFNQGSGRSDW